MRYVNLIKNISNWGAYFLYKYHIHRPPVMEFKGRGGVRITVPQRLMQTFKEIFFAEDYTRKLVKELWQKRDITMIDVGANAGYFSLYMLDKCPGAKVLAFEPIPRNFDLLKAQQAMNPGFDLQPFNEAVSDQDGSLTLQFDANDEFTTAASIFDTDTGSDTLEVPAVSLATIMERHQLASIDFLKLDCEGAEYPILYSCPDTVLSKIKVLALETHPGVDHDQQKPALVNFLQEKGFQLLTDHSDLVWAWRL